MTEKKTSTAYMRNLRGRLRAEGYASKEVWVLPENMSLLRKLELQLRQPISASGLQLEKDMQVETWNIASLYRAITQLDMVTSGEVSATLIEGAEQTIQLNMNQLDGLPVFVAVIGEQIIVDALLVEADDVLDVGEFNSAVLRSRDLFPLSSIGLETLPDGKEVYSIFGALSSASSLSNIATEIDTLLENIQRSTDVFSVYFKQEAN